MNTSVEKPHPLDETLKRVSLVNENIVSDIGQCDADFFPAIHLIQNDTTILHQALAKQATKHPTMDSRTQASYFIDGYSWYVPAVAIVTYLTEGRVPDFTLENIALRYQTYTWHHDNRSGEAERIEVRFLSGRFACLPDDPSADHPDATPVADSVSLLDWLRSQLENHFSPLIKRLHTVSKLGKNALWRLVADSCALQFLQFGKKTNQVDHMQVEGLAFIQGEQSPMNNPQTHYITLEHATYQETFRVRGGCCRYYTLPDAEYCTSCVLLKSEERDRRLLTYMQSKHEEHAS